MNGANVIPLSAPQSVSYRASTKRAAAPNPVCVRFGAFQLDEANARLSRDGTAITLAPRPFGLLCALVRRSGSLLTKNELLDDVWGHQFVSESVLKTAISDLRTVLDDDAREPRFIETVSRRGYRFIAPTTAIPGPTSIFGKASVRRVELHDHKIELCRSESGCALPQPVFATMEEVCYAHQLRLKLRALLLGDAAPVDEPSLAGVC
jgi:DNA-binding winged helix-turn-helix (wHTH) protein